LLRIRKTTSFEGVKSYCVIWVDGGNRLGTLNNSQKSYELTDHLGNVRAVLSNKNFVVNATDYYPFGIVSRGYSAGGYSFG
jgi:hypothetical protein